MALNYAKQIQTNKSIKTKVNINSPKKGNKFVPCMNKIVMRNESNGNKFCWTVVKLLL